MEDLKAALAQAYSLPPEESSGGTYIGSVERGDRVFQLYKDNNNQYRYKTMFKTAYGLIDETEKIFGKKITPQRKGKRY